MNVNGVRNFRHRGLPSSDRFLDLFSPPKPSAVSAADEFSESDVLWTVSESTRPKLGLRPPEKSGILAAMAEDGARPRAIPKPSRVGSESTRRMRNSAPVNVPRAMRQAKRFSEMDDYYEDEDEDEDEMMPPHEIVAMKMKTSSSSVLEGVGRTLKGRDLRQVRDAVWRQSGFID
ncbi:hypothetical protein vseg_003356 [Gypsophila vaccaria]